jgi:hypothetical protein
MELRRFYAVKIKGIEKALADFRCASRQAQHLAVFVLLTGLHSMLLGVLIFFFTETFYRLFFFAEIENFFFVRQAGLLLFCLGLFNAAILRDMKHCAYFVNIIVVTKALAFLFLLSHAHFTAWPPIIYLAAIGDGLMAVALLFLQRRVLQID